MWDPMYIDAAVYGSDLIDFTDNNVEIFYYEDPSFSDLNNDESPANVEN